jgi:localization factor PodJL
MKSAVAWNVKGVGADARETAREAARRAGMSVGEWLNSVIMESADDIDGTADESADDDFSAIHEHLDALATRLGKLRSASRSRPGERRGADVASDLRGLETWLAGITKDLARCSEETPQRVADAINRLNERLDHLIASGRLAASEFERRVTAVDRAFDDLNGETRRPAFPFKRRAEATEDVVSDIRTRQGALDGVPSRDPGEDLDRRGDVPGWRNRASELDQHLRTLTRQLDTMRRPCGFEDSVAALRRDLGSIGDALSKAMPRCALDALENEVQSLAERADRGRRHGDSAGIAAIERRLGKVHDLLNELTPAENVGGLEAAADALSRKIDTLASSGADATAVQHLETAIAELRALSGRVASGEALAVLACEVRTLAERMDRFVASAGKSAVSSLERRLEALSQSINARTAEAGRAVSARIEPLLNALAAQLERLDPGGNDQVALDHIEGEIARLADKINASDARVGNIDSIERALADLFLQIEETRANAVEASEFKRDLADLRLTQTEAELRTQQTFEAVQDAVERLADRLAAMEGGPRAEPAQPPLTAPARPAAPVAIPTPPPAAAKTPNPRSAKSSAPAPAAERTAVPPAFRTAIEPTLPADHPLEPGSTGSRARPPAPAPEAGDKASFIAAARRAAQAAAAGTALPGVKRTDDKTPAAAGEAGDMLAKLKRPVVMSVTAAVLVVGAAHVALSMLGPSGSARIEAPRQTTEAVAPAPREPAKAAGAPANPPSRAADTHAGDSRAAETGTAKSMPAPIPGLQLFAPNPVTNFATAGPNAPAASTDITGSVPKAGGGAPSAPASPVAAAPAADTLPATIAGPGLRSAAAAGNAAAEYEIAVRYAEGRGVPQSLSEAARWLERAATKGLAPAQYRLGSFYEKGNGVKKDLEAARRLYTAAAEKGNARAMHNLAVLHAEGIDGRPEYKAAAQWFRKAAAYGIADSQYNLGILFARGIGVEQNLAESYKWFALAAQQGDQDAGRKRDDVATRLDPQSLVAAKLAAQTFTAESQPEEATTVKPAGDSWDRPAAPAAPPAAAAKPKAARRI